MNTITTLGTSLAKSLSSIPDTINTLIDNTFGATDNLNQNYQNKAARYFNSPEYVNTTFHRKLEHYINRVNNLLAKPNESRTYAYHFTDHRTVWRIFVDEGGLEALEARNITHASILKAAVSSINPAGYFDYAVDKDVYTFSMMHNGEVPKQIDPLNEDLRLDGKPTPEAQPNNIMVHNVQMDIEIPVLNKDIVAFTPTGVIYDSRHDVNPRLHPHGMFLTPFQVYRIMNYILKNKDRLTTYDNFKMNLRNLRLLPNVDEEDAVIQYVCKITAEITDDVINFTEGRSCTVDITSPFQVSTPIF